MKHQSIIFGHAERRNDRRLNEQSTARRAALVCIGLTVIAAVGLHVSKSFGNLGGVALCSLVGAAALLVATVAASEA